MLKNLLNFANGKKTLLGVIGLILIGAFTLLTGADIPNFTEPTSWADLLSIAGLALFGSLTGIGVTDKVAKIRTAEMAEVMAYKVAEQMDAKIKSSLIQKSAVLSAGEDLFPGRKF